MNIVKKTISKTKVFVQEHKVAVAVSVTSLVWYKLNRRAFSQYDNFLKEKGLYEEFWTPEED